MIKAKTMNKRLQRLENHLQQENPILVSAVNSFRKLDRIATACGFYSKDESHATQISWWPLISVLGTFSAGKSSFINHYLGYSLQHTGNQAIDDKFTVTCYGGDAQTRVLPGVSLDADPRLPFYRISEELEKVGRGEGARVDAYLQLKTCPTPKLKGKILIDSPGFDADDQRSATLRITNHIINLSDLVLVFFDARHPEPGAMHDTLMHLVRETVDRTDASKFMYILNQIDTTAREDNAEDVVGAWQRALAQQGLSTGRFYCIYNPDAAVHIEDEALSRRFEHKRDQDLGEIHQRMEQVSVERAYRIIASLDQAAQRIEEQYIPVLKRVLSRWRQAVVWTDLGLFLLLIIAALAASISFGYWEGLAFRPPWLDPLLASRPLMIGIGVGIFSGLYGVHLLVRRWFRKRVLKDLQARSDAQEMTRRIASAFIKNTKIWRSVFELEPVGWSRRNRTKLHQILADADRYIQTLNDQFTNPSGQSEQHEKPNTLVRVVSGGSPEQGQDRASGKSDLADVGKINAS